MLQCRLRQQLLRWAVEHGVAIVTTSTKESRIGESKCVFDEGCSLTVGELDAIDAVGATRRARGYWAEEFGDCYEGSEL